MRVKHLQSWLAAATCKERPETTNWDQFVETTQTVFMNDRLTEECAWKTAILITKRKIISGDLGLSNLYGSNYWGWSTIILGWR